PPAPGHGGSPSIRRLDAGRSGFGQVAARSSTRSRVTAGAVPVRAARRHARYASRFTQAGVPPVVRTGMHASTGAAPVAPPDPGEAAAASATRAMAAPERIVRGLVIVRLLRRWL